MKCSGCGHESKEEQANFCSNCGLSLRVSIPAFVNQEKKEPVKDDTMHKTNMETEMEMLGTTIVIRSCIQNAICLLKDDENVESRSTRRIEILIGLLRTKDQIKSNFLKMLKNRLYKLLKMQEENVYNPEQWVIREAANQEALQEAGTFRQTLWKRVQKAVTPLVSQILSIVDRNANLELLVNPHLEDYVKCLWMHIFYDEKLLLISESHSSQNETILVKNYMNVSVFGENRFPFSWRIKDYLEDIWTQAQHIDSAEGPAFKFLDIFSKTPLGKYICSEEENTQHNLFLNYKRDFILMTMIISSAEELQVIEFALSACIEELRSSTNAKEPLQLPWVHIGYSIFQHRLQNLNRILVVNPSVLDPIIQKIANPQPRNEMVLDIYAAIACLESLKESMRRSDPQEWMRKVKNIQVPIELTCSEGYLKGQGAWCKIGIKQIRKLWNCVYSMALFMEHLLVAENLQDENMHRLIIGHTWSLGNHLEHFADLKTARPLMAVVDALHKCRNYVATSVSRECIQKNIEFRKQANGFFMDIVCNLCFKDNEPPDDEVIDHLISLLFDKPDSLRHTRSLSPFEDAVDKTPVIRSVILKLLLKYSFDNIMKHAQDYLDRVKRSNLLKIADTKEVYLLFINCLEDSLYEKKQKVRNENEKHQYFEMEVLFLENFSRRSKRQTNEETSVQLLQDVARVRLALDVAAEMLSLKPKGSINEQYLRCIEVLCSQSGNDWYRVYLIRKLANLDGLDMVQRHFKDPAFRWLFPQDMLQKRDTETNHIDHFLVCGESYKVLREGISRAMMEGKQERIAAAIEGCQNKDQKLVVHLLLAVFREITLYYGVRNNGQQNTAPEHESVMEFIKNAKISKDRPLKQSLMTNSWPFLQAVPDMKGSYVTVFGLAVHLASILLSGNNHLLAPLKNLSFSCASMQNSFLPTMPEDMLSQARNVMREPVHWYCCPNGHYCAIGECGQPMEVSRCLDCGVVFGGQNHRPQQGFTRILQNVDQTQTGHVLGDPDRQGPAVAPDRDIAAPAFILLRMITHLAMLLGTEQDMQSLSRIVKPPVPNVANFIFRHIEKDLEYLRNCLGESADDTTTFVHLVLDKMLSPRQSGNWPVNFDEVWSTKDMRNIWEKHFVSMVITPVLGEQESVMEFIKNANIFKDRPLKQFLESLMTNSRPFLQAVPGMRGSYVTIFGLAVHLASILLSGNNHLLAPLKNLSFSCARMKTSYLPTMPEDMLSQARNVMRKQLHWYRCSNGHYCAIEECSQSKEVSRCLDCGVVFGGQNQIPQQGFIRIAQNVDQTQIGHVLGNPDRQGPAVAPDRDIAAPAFILLRMITHLAMLLGSEEDMQSLARIVKPPVPNVANFIFRHIEKDLEYLRNNLGKSADDTTTVVHLVLDKMLSPRQPGNWPVNFDEVWSTKEMRNIWEKHFVSMVITPVLGSLDKDLMTVNNYISQDERISFNPVVKVVYGDPLLIGEKMDLPQDNNVYCSRIWSCRERISIEYILHTVQQQDGNDTLPLLWKFLENETELQMVKFLPDILKLQKYLVKKFQNYKDINYKTVQEFLHSIKSAGAQRVLERCIQNFMLAWNHLRFSLQTKVEIKLPEGMCDEILTMDSDFEFLLPRRQGLGLGATALTSYLIALHNSFIYALAQYTNIEQNYSIKASDVTELHVISYELEKHLVPIILSNCQYSLESGKETLQEFDFPKIQHQLATRLLQGKPLINMTGLPTLTLSHDRNYEHLYTDLKKKLPQDSLSNSAIDVISKGLNAFSDVCEALNIVDISLGFLATSGGDPELSLIGYVEDVLQMKEQSSTHVLEALKHCHLKNTIALWQLLTALKSQHLLHLKRDPFANVDSAYKHKLGKERQHALNVFLEQNGINCFLLELHEMIVLKLGKPRSADDFPPSWILKDVLTSLLDGKDVSFPELENDFPEQIALAHCIEAWKVAATKKWSRI